MVFLYRKNGGQVLGVSTEAAAYTGVDATYFGVVTDPQTPDGTDLAVAKIYDLTTLRNATAPEITTFAAAVTMDTNLQQRAAAITRLQVDPTMRKILGAIVGSITAQISQLRTQPTTTFSAVTFAQAKQAIVDAINAGTYD